MVQCTAFAWIEATGSQKWIDESWQLSLFCSSPRISSKRRVRLSLPLNRALICLPWSAGSGVDLRGLSATYESVIFFLRNKLESVPPLAPVAEVLIPG